MEMADTEGIHMSSKSGSIMPHERYVLNNERQGPHIQNRASHWYQRARGNWPCGPVTSADRYWDQPGPVRTKRRPSGA
jgi:nitrous oxidase accessory protein NosD